MRYAVISDLHANRQAFQAVLADIRTQNIDEIICLGDVVGYGPSPAEVLEKAYASVHHFILGNHDAVIAGKLDPSCFNDDARRVIDWTSRVVDGKAAKFFKKLPLIIQGENVLFTHGEFAEPGHFGYIYEPDEARVSFDSCKEQLLFAGHTHVPGIHVVGQSGTVHWIEPMDFCMEAGKRYIVNPGSVGQPRDNDFRASYAIHDTADQSVSFHKVSFDIDGFRQDIRKAGIGEQTSYFLLVADEMSPPPLRKMLAFTPSENVAVAASESDVQSLAVKVDRLKRRQTALLAAVCMLIIAFTFVLYQWLSVAPEKDDAFITFGMTAKESGTKTITPLHLDLIQPCSFNGKVTKETPLKNWTVKVTDEKAQSVFVTNPTSVPDEKDIESVPFFTLSSKQKLPLEMIHRAVSAVEGGVFSAAAQFKGVDFVKGGNLYLFMELVLEDGREITYGFKDATQYKYFLQDRWTTVKFTPQMEIAEPGLLRLVIRGDFEGEVQVRKCQLIRKK